MGKCALVCLLGLPSPAIAATQWTSLFSGDQAFGIAQTDPGGEIQLAGRRLLGASAAQVWTVGPSGQISDATLFPLPGGMDSVAFRLSDQGRYIAGYSESFSAQPFLATRWQVGQFVAPISVGSLPGGSASSAAFDVADSGAVVGLSQGAFPFLWLAATGIQPLRGFDGSVANGSANWIAPDARTIAGSAADASGSLRAARWTEQGRAILELDDPVGLDSAAASGSPNGRNFSGNLFDGFEFVAVVWIDGRLYLLEDDQGLPLQGIARAVLNDGTTFGAAEIDGVERGFVWNPIFGSQVQLLDDVYAAAAGASAPVQSADVRDALSADEHYHLAVLDQVEQGHYVELPALAVAPWEVGELSIDGTGQWSWEAQVSGTEYDVIRGNLQQLISDGDVTGAACIGNDLGAVTLSDGAVGTPAAGEVRYVLVRSSNPQGESEWGGDYSGASRPNAGVCP